MTNKIRITGVHGSGKSTLARELVRRSKQSGKTVYVVREVARNCPHPLRTVDAQEYIWISQMNREKFTMRQDVDTIISDRTVMDNLIYYHAVLEDTVGEHNDSDPWKRWDQLYKQAIAWMSTYDIVIRLPLNLEWLKSDDPIRPKSEEYAIRIDRLFDVFVDKWVSNHGWK